MNYRGNFKSFPEGLIGFIILIAPLAMPGRTANAQQGVVTQAHATQILNSEADGKQSTEEDEICRLVIKVDFPKTDNQASPVCELISRMVCLRITPLAKHVTRGCENTRRSAFRSGEIDTVSGTVTQRASATQS